MSRLVFLALLAVACGTAPPADLPEDSPEPVQPAAQGPAHWAGVPLDQLGHIGLGEPTLDRQRDLWQAPADDGWVRMVLHPTDASARQAFAFEVTVASSKPHPPLELSGADEAVGDGEGFVAARSHNVVVVVRHHDGHAGDLAEEVLSELQRDGPREAWRVEGPMRWDRFGRHLDPHQR